MSEVVAKAQEYVAEKQLIPRLNEQQIFLALLTGAMAKATVTDYDAKSTAGKNRIKKLMDMAKSMVEVYNA